MASYTPSLNDIADLMPEDNAGSANVGYTPSLKDIADLVPNTSQSFLQKLATSVSNNIPSPGMPAGLNIASGLFSLASQNPQQQNMIANLPQVATGQQPTDSQQIEHSIGKNSPSFAMPEAGSSSFLLNALSRIAGQSAFGVASNPGDRLDAGESFGGLQTVMEAIPAAGNIAKIFAEQINPMKFAGQIAEQARTMAQSAKNEANTYYNPVNEKYNDSWVTPTPKQYLDFKPEDTQYFKPDVNRAYRDFNAEPSFGNLHTLQSKMGAYPELAPLREGIKGKIQSFLSNDPEMLELYNTGSNILKNNYYPYVSNDILKDVVEHQKPITQFDPVKLSKALNDSPMVQASNKAEQPIEHPIVNLATQMTNKLNTGQLVQHLLPTILGGITGNFIEPALGTLGGAGAGALFGKYGEPQLLKLAQNPSAQRFFSGLHNLGQNALRQALGYQLYGQQQQQQ